jgi:hypothetical protein
MKFVANGLLDKKKENKLLLKKSNLSSSIFMKKNQYEKKINTKTEK